MKITRFFMVLAVLFFMGYVKSAQALTFVSLIDFPNPTTIADTTSGNNIDFAYTHLLTGLNPNQIVITDVSLSLTHFGNANTGPTNEIWRAFWGGGHLIGQLSGSNAQATEDIWQLSPDILNEILGANPLSLQVGLSEQTSFNGERVELRKSLLTIQYNSSITTPEMSSFGMVLGSLISLGLGWMKRKN